MVEFGLKLQDNQVSEWRAHYIDYEVLKTLLKKAKKSLGRYEELAKSKPELAQQIKNNFDNGVNTYITTTPPMSSDKLSGLVRSLSAGSLSAKATIKEEEEEDFVGTGTMDERTSLLPKDKKTITDNDNDDDKQSRESGEEAITSSPKNSVHGVLSKAVSSVSGYFEKRYETTVRDSLAEIIASENEFDTQMNAEVDKVNNFYDSKVEELEKRLQLLTDSVAQALKEKYGDEHKFEDNMSPTIVSERKKAASVAETRKHSKIPSLDNWRELVSRITRKNSNSSQPDEAEAKRKRQQLTVLDIDDLDGDDPDSLVRDKSEVKKIAEADSIQRALVDQYRTSKLLHNFAIMNYTGFVKIVKKHDKSLPHRKGKFKALTQPAKICDEGKAVEKMAARLELRYANWFCDGNLREAYAQLLPKRGDGLETDWSQLRLGYRMGMCAVLGLWVCWDCIWGFVQKGTSTIGGRTAFPVFRACGGLLCLQWFWGCSVFMWTRYRVNYIYLFDFDPRIVASPLAIFNDAVDNTLIFLWCMLLYYKAGAHDIPQVVPSGFFPFILVLYTLYCLIFPLRTRVPMWRAVWHVITAPMTSPSFFHGYVGDIFTSMVKVFQDIAWTICFVGSGDWLIDEDTKASTKHAWAHTFWYKNVLLPVICLLPLVFRFNQCLRRFKDTGKRFPHLANAFKYALSQTVTLFGAFHPLYLMHKNPDHHGVNMFQIFWMAVFVTSSLYSFTWDVFMDWGLGQRKYQFLAPTLMYPNRIYYYYIIAADLVLRFMWVLTLLPPQSGAKFEVPNYLTALVMMLELFRRTIWGFLRLENEHRSNTAGFRRVGFVPLHFKTGHDHKYEKEEMKHQGKGVLAELAAVAIAVCAVCVYSVVAAQRATRGMEPT